MRLFQPFQRARQIGDLKKRGTLRCPAGHLAGYRSQSDRSVPGRNHRVYACRIRTAQAGTEIVRILNTIEYQQQRRFVQTIQQLIEQALPLRFGKQRAGDHTLMIDPRNQPVELVTGGRLDDDSRPVRQRGYLTDTLILAPRLDPQLDDRSSAVAQRGAYAVQAGNQLGRIISLTGHSS